VLRASHECRCNIRTSLHRLLDAVQRASLFLLIIHNMPNSVFSGIFKRKKKDGLARTASHQSASSVSSLAASSTPVRTSLRTVRKRLIHSTSTGAEGYRYPPRDPGLYTNRSQLGGEVSRWMPVLGPKGSHRRCVRDH
jgi:hypothetical protein